MFRMSRLAAKPGLREHGGAAADKRTEMLAQVETAAHHTAQGGVDDGFLGPPMRSLLFVDSYH